MNPGSTYPLAPLAAVRRTLEEEARRRLAEAVAELEDRERDEREAGEAARAASARLAEAEAERLEAGPQTAHALMAADAHRAALRASRRAAEAASAVASVRRREAADALETRRRELAAARADTRAVESHRESWQAQRAREGERRSEAEADDRSSGRGVSR